MPGGTRPPTVRQMSGRRSASICTTSAPSSDNNCVASVPDHACVKASTRTPPSGPAETPPLGAPGAPDATAVADDWANSRRSASLCSPSRGAGRGADQIGGSIRPGAPAARTARPSMLVCATNPRSASCSFSASSSTDCRQPEMQRSRASA